MRTKKILTIVLFISIFINQIHFIYAEEEGIDNSNVSHVAEQVDDQSSEVQEQTAEKKKSDTFTEEEKSNKKRKRKRIESNEEKKDNVEVNDEEIQPQEADKKHVDLSQDVNAADAATTTQDEVSSEKNVNTHSEENNSQNENQNSSVLLSNSNSQNYSSGNIEVSSSTNDVTIKSDDVFVAATVVSSVNSDVNSISVSDFTVSDNHRGDIVVDFSSNCAAECSVQKETKDNSTVSLTLTANTGENRASGNTNAATGIATGNAYVSATALTFANTVLEGKFQYTSINIFGNLDGDIIVSNLLNNSCENCSLNAKDSEFNFQSRATIDTSIDISATTGNNQYTNTNADSSKIQTGNSVTAVSSVVLANTMLQEKNAWLIIINQAGDWIGNIFAKKANGTVISSEDLGIDVGENGELFVLGDQGNNSIAHQHQTSTISTSIAAFANTGSNTIDNNTTVEGSIRTGDAKVIANVLSFANTKIAKDSSFLITVINIFGSWRGDLLTPGTSKEEQKEDESETIASSTETIIETPTPTPTAQIIQTEVAAASYYPPIFSKTKKSEVVKKEKPASSKTTVKGIHASVVTINLAWFLLAVPFIGIVFLKKKRG